MKEDKDDKSTTVVSVRMASSLLRAVRARARVEGRSVSGEIVAMVSARVSAQAKRRVLPITGWLARSGVPESHAEFREARRQASKRFFAGKPRGPRSRRTG